MYKYVLARHVHERRMSAHTLGIRACAYAYTCRRRWVRDATVQTLGGVNNCGAMGEGWGMTMPIIACECGDQRWRRLADKGREAKCAGSDA